MLCERGKLFTIGSHHPRNSTNFGILQFQSYGRIFSESLKCPMDTVPSTQWHSLCCLFHRHTSFRLGAKRVRLRRGSNQAPATGFSTCLALYPLTLSQRGQNYYEVNNYISFWTQELSAGDLQATRGRERWKSQWAPFLFCCRHGCILYRPGRARALQIILKP